MYEAKSHIGPPLHLTLRDVQPPFSGFDSVANDAVSRLLKCKTCIEDWRKQLDDSMLNPPSTSARSPNAIRDLSLRKGMDKLREDAEEGVNIVVHVVQTHHQLFRAMSQCLETASNTGSLLPSQDIVKIALDISSQIEALTQHIALMKGQLVEVEDVIESPRSITRRKSFHLCGLGAALTIKQTSRNRAADPQFKQLLYDLKRTIPRDADTAAKTLSAFRISHTVQQLEIKLSIRGSATIPKAAAKVAQNAWASEAEDLPGLH